MRKTRYYKALIASTISKPDSSGFNRGIQGNKIISVNWIPPQRIEPGHAITKYTESFEHRKRCKDKAKTATFLGVASAGRARQKIAQWRAVYIPVNERLALFFNAAIPSAAAQNKKKQPVKAA